MAKNSSMWVLFVFLGMGIGNSMEAQGPGGRPMPRLALQALDLDHDGKLSAAELQAAPGSLLTLDKNGDGRLTVDELTGRPENAGAAPGELVKQLMSFDKGSKGYLVLGDLPARMQGLFTRADANHDGKLTPDELNALSARQGMPSGPPAEPGRAAGMFRLDPLLNALDTNHDGEIEADEIQAASASLLTLDKDHNGEIEASEMPVRQQTPEERAEHMLKEFDTDGDGKISRAEAPERMAQQFDQMDTNHDGFLEQEEVVGFYKTQGNQPRRTGSSPEHPQQ